MSLNLHLPENIVLKPRITVFGIGGAGGNAVNNMISANLEGVNFVAANTDAQALEHSLTANRIQLGEKLTRGLGAGANPGVGAAAAEEAITEIKEYMQGCNMVFITAGMGGGTGTGAAPVIAKLAKEQDVLTVGVVTKPFHFEGAHRMRLAEKGVQELQSVVDTLIIIPNQNLFRIANEKTTFADAFKMADSVLHAGVRGITDLMTMPGLINLDFADIRAVMSEMGKAMMGTGEAEGEQRAIEAAEAAIANPLLDNVSMKGARGVLINITGGPDMTLFEVDEAANRIREEVDPDANIIFGSTFSPDMEGSLRVSVVATGIDAIDPRKQQPAVQQPVTPQPEPIVRPVPPRLDDRPIPERPVEVAQVQQSQPQPSVTYRAPEPKVATAEEYTISYHQPVARQFQAEGEDDGDVLVAPPKETSTHFVAAKPMEPTSSGEAYGATRNAASSKDRAAVRPQQPAPAKGLSLFGRMAAGMGLGRSNYEDEPAAASTSTKRDDTVSAMIRDELNNASIKEDVVNIPAYLRKKIESE